MHRIVLELKVKCLFAGVLFITSELDQYECPANFDFGERVPSFH